MEAVVVATHLLVGSIGVAAVTAFAWSTTQESVQVFVPTFDHRRASQLLLTLPGYPLQFLNGMILGFALAKRLGGWISQFVWVIPLGVALLVWLNEPEPSVFFEHYRFDGTCPPVGNCFAKATATLLVMSSVSYSLGAVVGLKKRWKADGGILIRKVKE
jgi:hypothetical protein